jgi:lysophospholipase L1-like esterase
VRKLALLVTAVALTLGLGEAVLRAFWHNPFATESPDLLLTLRWQHANTDRLMDRSVLHLDPPKVRFRTDSRGFIEPVTRVQSPEFTLVFQGGSTTECVAVQEELRWPNLVPVQLEPLGFRVNALNAGKSANTAHDSLVNLVELVGPSRPDVVLLMNAVNDAGLLAEFGYSRHGANHDGWRQGLRWLGQTLSSHSALAGLVRRAVDFPGRVDLAGVRTQASALPGRPDPLPYAARVRAWVRTARAYGSEPVLITEPLSTMRNEFTPPWTDAGALADFNERVRAIGLEEGATVIDLAALVQTELRVRRPEELFYDGLHVNDDGSRLYARLVAGELAREVLPRLRARAYSPQSAR